MNNQTIDPYRHKKIKGVFIIMTAITITLGYNAFLVYHSQSTTTSVPTVATTTQDEELDSFTLAEVAIHDSADSCWMAAYGNVYDITPYVQESRHPGGQNSLLSGCGTEATDSFDRIHSSRAKDQLAEFKIGILAE